MFLFIILQTTFAYKNIVFHGLGDQCSNSGMAKFAQKLNADCIEVGNGAFSSISMSFQEQSQNACETVKETYKNQKINIIGLSQGALIARYIITDCDFGGSVNRYISIGGPQMGVSKFPHCKGGIFCWPINGLVRELAYSTFTLNHVGPAGYFRNNYDLSDYLERCNFLPELNNERSYSQQRKSRFSSLDKVMLIKFENDHMIFPKETAHFETLDENDQILPLKDSDIYKKDLIGLKQLMDRNKVEFISVKGDHLEMNDQEINDLLVPFLN